MRSQMLLKGSQYEILLQRGRFDSRGVGDACRRLVSLYPFEKGE